MTLVLASHNAHKIAEIRAILAQSLGGAITLLSLDDIGRPGDIAETGQTFEENAALKAEAGLLPPYGAVADDSGLAVDALGGAPGVRSARYAGEPCSDAANNRKLLAALAGLPRERRGAAFISVIVCILPSGERLTARGECRGEILSVPRGQSGFGYDPLFYYPPLQKTFAQLTPAEKNAVSHRSRALSDLVRQLKDRV